MSAVDTGHRGALTATPRRSRRLLWAAVAVAVTLAAVLTAVALTRGTTRPSVRATSAGGLVAVTGQSFPSSTAVDVLVRFQGGTAAASVRTDGEGRFSATFRPAGGTTGRAEVSAQAQDVRASTTVTVVPGTVATAPEQPSTGGAVPGTGPSGFPERPVDPALPRRDVPATIPADCSTDVSGPLNAWLAGVPDRSTVVFPAGGCYVVNSSLTLDRRNDLVIDGQGATFKATTPVADHNTERAQWRLDYGNRITLRDLTVLGVNPAPVFQQQMEFDHNIFIRGTHTVTIENVHGGHAYGDFISIAQGVDGTTIPSDVTITAVSADTIGRNGISCVACDGVSVTGSVLGNIALHAFDLEIEGDGRPGRRVTFSGNTVEQHGLAVFSVGTPFQTHGNDLSDVVITDNTVTEPGSATDQCIPAISFLYSKIPARHVVITGNRLISRTDAIMVKSASDVTIRDNTAALVGPSCGDPVGIRTSGVSGADVRDNTMTGYRRAYAAG